MPKITLRLPQKGQANVRGPDSEAPLESGIVFINTTGEEIPAYGVFQGHGTRNATFLPAIVIAKKPIDEDANASAIFVNGPHAVPNNDFGYAQDGPLYQVLHNGDAATGERLGLEVDYWEAVPDESGPLLVIGEDDVRENVVLCLLQSASTAVERPKSGLARIDTTVPACSYGFDLDGNISTIIAPSIVVRPYLQSGLNPNAFFYSTTAEDEITLHNPNPVPIPAGSVAHYKECEFSGRRMIDTWICATGILGPGGGGPNPEPPTEQDSLHSQKSDLGIAIRI